MTTPNDRDVTRPRPNPLSPYQCGFNDIGVRCIPGPTADGQCCQSTRDVCKGEDSCSGCTLKEKCDIAGKKQCCGENQASFKACIPIKSHWYSRNVLGLNLAILAGGLLLVCMALPTRERFFVPGSLSRSHTQILENTLISDRCSLCHPGAHSDASQPTQDQLCMNCHNSHMPDASKSMPHDLTQDQFARLISFRDKQGPKTDSHPIELQQTKCAQCHIEHHGSEQDLKALTDSRCQSCHADQFKSFSSGHPEFSSFPSIVPRHIAFDHRSHLEKYYAQKGSAFDCKTCHELDPENQTKILRTASFEAACASCHQEPMRASMSDGWAVLQLPSLNDADLRAGGELLNPWPSGALYGYDGKLTLPMRLLLSADESLQKSLLQFPDGDLSKVRPRDVQQQAAARDIARGFRQLLRDTANEGQEAWKVRLTTVATKALGRSPKADEQKLIRNMIAGLPPDLFRQADVLWFDQRNRALSSVEKQGVMSLVSTQDLLLDDSKKPLDDEDADSLLRGSSTEGLNYKNQAGTNPPAGKSLPSNKTPAATQTPAANQTQPPPRALNNPTLSVTSTQSFELQRTPPKATSNSVTPKQSEILGGDDGDLSADELLKSPSSGSTNKPTQVPANGSVATAKDQSNSTGVVKFAAKKQIGEGGWYLDSQLYTVKYMPTGHADSVIAAWIQFAALVDSASSSAAQPAIDERMPSWHTPNWKPGSEAVGGCTECHLLPTTSNFTAGIEDWRAKKPSLAKSFTKFSHKPHTTLAVTSDCKHCHRFDTTQSQRFAEIEKSTGEALSRFVRYQKSQQHFQCEFTAIEKSQCNACHRSGGAAEGCTQCHNYHVGTAGFEADLGQQ